MKLLVSLLLNLLQIKGGEKTKVGKIKIFTIHRRHKETQRDYKGTDNYV